MGEKTGVSWCESTFNGWIGCTKVSPGCVNCYAERDNNFYRWNKAGWGPDAPRHRTSDANWRKPLAWNKAAERDGIRRRVFTASLSDVCDYHPSIKPEWYRALAQLIIDTPWLDWLFLAKRPENFYLIYGELFPMGFPDNLWFGTTAENQEMANLRIPMLWLYKSFLSIEPMLERIDLGDMSDIRWVITGGESGPNARPFDPAWALDVRDQCRRAGVAYFHKQNGGNRKVDGVWGGNTLDGAVYHEFPKE